MEALYITLNPKLCIPGHYVHVTLDFVVAAETKN
jgi:hypothetical protein